jgi:ATP-dependent Lhr-like helicase
MREEDRPHSVVCTNTLELGIDIGQLELAVQIDSTIPSCRLSSDWAVRAKHGAAVRIMQIYSSELAHRAE